MSESDDILDAADRMGLFYDHKSAELHIGDVVLTEAKFQRRQDDDDSDVIQVIKSIDIAVNGISRRFDRAIEEDRVFVGGRVLEGVKLIQRHERDEGPPLRTGLPESYLDRADGEDLEAIAGLVGPLNQYGRMRSYEASATMSLDRKEWERFKRALTPQTLHIGRLGGRRAVAIDRVRWPRPKFEIVRVR